jgi:cytochrome c oxidase subunit II
MSASRSLGRNLQRWAVAALGVAGTWVHAAVQPEAGIGLPRDVSVDGHRIDWLMNVTHVFNILLFVIMCVWMGWACLMHNRKHEAEYDHGNGKRNMTMALSLSALIFFVVDGNLFFKTMTGLSEAFWNWDIPAKNEKTVRIEINAHQWAWDGRYAGADKKFSTEDDVQTWNDFKVPVNTPIYLQLTSTDVIHSFSLPNLRVKMDAVPGQVNHMWFQATTVGEYEVGCTQHCGTHHYKMKALLTVLSEEDYRKWEAEASVQGKLAFDPEDTKGDWGWEWKDNRY